MKILIVEDEPGLRATLVDLLEQAGHSVVAVGDGELALDAGRDPEVDLVLLDLMIPKRGGLAVCEVLRRARPDLFIVILTAKGAEEHKVEGLDRGADDYITKPFGARELLARVAAFERRRDDKPAPVEEISADGCTFNLGRLVAVRGRDERTLTAREAAILRYLHRHRARAVTRAELLEHVWNTSGDLATRTVDMTIANLRQKVERDPAQPRIVVTVKGLGYAWGNDS
jgi:DNA-binding response OmpR family regulator